MKRHALPISLTLLACGPGEPTDAESDTTEAVGGSASSGETGETSASTTGTSETVTDTGGGTESETGSASDTCAAIDGRSFSSLEELECGLGPMGPFFCNWTIEFAAGMFLWSHSDVGESGPYRCDGDAIDGGSAQGTYDQTSGQLTWDGVLYD